MPQLLQNNSPCTGGRKVQLSFFRAGKVAEMEVGMRCRASAGQSRTRSTAFLPLGDPVKVSQDFTSAPPPCKRKYCTR